MAPHLETFLSYLFVLPGPVYAAVGIALFLCCLIGYDLDTH